MLGVFNSSNPGGLINNILPKSGLEGAISERVELAVETRLSLGVRT